MIGKIISTALIIALLGTSSYLIYVIYQDNYSPVRSFSVNYTQLEIQPSYPDSELQFYPNMRFNHNDLSYSGDYSCPTERLDNIKEAFSIIQSKAEIISFFETDNNPDISVSCSEENIEEEKSTFIAGRGGAEGKVPFSGVYYILPKGNVTLYKEINCRLPVVEIHEILHVLGFNHSASKTSIMYPVSSCNQAITNDIIDELKRLYSIPALPDLYLSNISGIKKGRYLSLNFSVRNQGLKDSGDITIILYGDNKEISRFNLESIEPGSGISYSVQNIRTSSDSLRLIVRDGKEINDENNNAELSLS